MVFRVAKSQLPVGAVPAGEDRAIGLDGKCHVLAADDLPGAGEGLSLDRDTTRTGWIEGGEEEEM